MTQCVYPLMALPLGLGNQLYAQTQLGHNPTHLSLTTLRITGVMETHGNDSGFSPYQIFYSNMTCLYVSFSVTEWTFLVTKFFD